MVAILSNTEPLEPWEPNVVFVKQKSKESSFTKEKEEGNLQVFQEASLVPPTVKFENLEQPTEDLR